ncbi:MULTISPECIES: hypothetical protein [Bacillus cereus group]|nr:MULTISPECIES: hypothetical protein [Bacillus cereus group]
MVTIDDNTRIAIEVIAQTFKLSEQALLHVLKSLTKLLENNEQPPEDYILDENTKIGKQKISELIKKHNKDGGGFGILWFIDLFLLSGRVDYKNALFSVLVQKLRENCNEFINLGHTDTITLERVRDQYGKGEFV